MLNRYKAKHPTDQAMVDFMAQTEQFTYADIKQNVTSTQSRRANLVSSLVRQRLIFEVGREDGQKVWTTKKDNVGRAATKIKRGSNDGRIWSAMRTMGVFTPDELFAICANDDVKISFEYVRTYCRKLQTAGYFAVIEKARSGGRSARYKLVRDTGPLPPAVKTLECVVDGNTDKAMYVSGGRL